MDVVADVVVVAGICLWVVVGAVAVVVWRCALLVMSLWTLW